MRENKTIAARKVKTERIDGGTALLFEAGYGASSKLKIPFTGR